MTLELFLILCAAALAAFVAAEWIARWVLQWRQDYWVLTPFQRTVMEIDHETLPALEATVRIEVNADGERGDPVRRDWSETYRVLVAGGSAAECFLLDQRTSWPAVIQRRLSEPESLARLGVRSAHVGNVSRSLVACEYIDEILRRVLPRYERLDLVVLMVGASDVVNWLERKTPERLEPGKLSDSYVFAEHPGGPYGWRPKKLALWRIASRWNRRLRRPTEYRKEAGKTIGKNRRMRAAAREIIDEVPDPAPLLEYFETFFREMVQRAARKAGRVIVVRQPWFEKEHTPEEKAALWNFGVGRPYVEEVTTYFSHRVVSELMRAVDGVATRVAAECGVEQVDLMPVLDRSLETYYDFLHFTPAGARVVGEAVAAKVLAEPAPARDASAAEAPSQARPGG